MPDSHGCYADEMAISAMFADADVIRPKEVILLGDHLECGGFLARSINTLGYVAQSAYTFEDDVSATNQFLDRLQSISSVEEIDYIEGNHERRIESWCCTQALKNKQDAAYLLQLFSANSVLSIEKRGIRWIRQGVFL